MAKGRGAGRPRFRLVPTVLLTLAILLLPTAVYAWGRTSSSFSIEKVVVTGADLVPQQRLQRLLRKDFLGSNLFTVATDDVRETLKPLQYVASVAIDRDFPTTLRVHIEEHEPVAYVFAGKRWYVVASDAHVIAAIKTSSEATATATATVAGSGADAGLAVDDPSASTPSPAGQPASDAAGGDAAEGDQVDGGAKDLALLEAGPSGVEPRLPRLAAAGKIEEGRSLDDTAARLAVTVIAGLPQSLRDRLAVAVVKDGRVTLRFGDGLLAVWGEGERGLAKTMALQAVLDRYDERSIDCTYIDVSTPDRVLARPMLK
jgi:cell division septal protein FtsQ